MTRTVFNWPALLGLIVVAALVAAIIPPALVHLNIIHEDSTFLVCMILGAGVGLLWPYPAFRTVDN